jgi:hypothetical protein
VGFPPSADDALQPDIDGSNADGTIELESEAEDQMASSSSPGKIPSSSTAPFPQRVTRSR